MTEQEYLLEIKKLKPNDWYSFFREGEINAKYFIERYCTIDKTDIFNYILIVNVKKIKHEKLFYIPKKVNKISLNIGCEGYIIKNYIWDSVQCGYDVFTSLLNDLVKLEIDDVPKM